MVKKKSRVIRCDWDKVDVNAIKALSRGEADEHQQKRALDWILNNACATYSQTFDIESERSSNFLEGRRFVGLQIVGVINISPALLTKENKQ